MANPPLPAGQSLIAVPVQNSYMPPEGPKAVSVRADFSQSKAYDINLLLAESLQQLSMIQGVFVDNSGNNAQVDIGVSVINQTVKISAESQGYYPIFAPKNATITVRDHSGTSSATISLTFYNMPMPASNWGNAFNNLT